MLFDLQEKEENINNKPLYINEIRDKIQREDNSNPKIYFPFPALQFLS